MRLCGVIAVMVMTLAVSGFSAELHVGDRAPSFTLPAATKDTLLPKGVSLSDVVGKNVVVLAFYPADWSGGCTKEMCTLRDNFAELANLHATVLGISGDYIFSHREWAKYLGLPFMLLSDHRHEIARQYESFNESAGYNMRTVYVIDREGTIRYKDLAYIAGDPNSYEKLRKAVEGVR